MKETPILDFIYSNKILDYILHQHWDLFWVFIVVFGIVFVVVRWYVDYILENRKINLLKNEYNLKELLLNNGFSDLKYPVLFLLKSRKKGIFCIGYEKTINSYKNNDLIVWKVDFIVDSNFIKYNVDYVKVSKLWINNIRLKKVELPIIIKTNENITYEYLENIVLNSVTINKTNIENIKLKHKENNIDKLICYLKY